MKVIVEEVEGLYVLMVESLAGKNRAGLRLERGGYLPVKEFEFFDKEDADISAEKLQAYLDKHCKRESHRRKSVSKRKG